MKLTNNLSFESFIQSCKDQYNHEQLYWLRRGYEDNLDISLYINPNFDSMQMHAIMCGLAHNIDVSKYAFVEYNSVIMGVIYHLLKNGSCFDKYVIQDRLDVDKMMRDYDLLVKYKDFSRLDTWALNMIYDNAPYYTSY